MPMSPRLLRPRAATGFTPKTLSGLQLWLDPSDETTVTLNGTTVSELRDKSGNNRHAVQATAANQPSYSATMNGRKVISAADTVRFLTSSFAYTATAQTWFLVCQKTDSANGNARVVTQLASGSDVPAGGYIPLFNSGGGAGSTTTSFAGGSAVASVANNLTSPALFISRHSGSQIRNSVNGVNSSAASHTLNRSFDSVRLLSHTTTGGFVGNVAELFFYSRLLSDAEISSAEAWLKRKWGFSY